MSYANMIRGQVRKAFNAVGDLAQLVTLSHQANAGFDFATNAVKTPVTTTKVIKGVLVEKKRTSEDKLSSTIQTSFLFKAEDLNDPTIYDSITTADSSIWKVVPPYQNDGFLITVNVTRSA